MTAPAVVEAVSEEMWDLFRTTGLGRSTLDKHTVRLLDALGRRNLMVVPMAERPAPYGWRWEDGERVKVAEEQRIIGEILRLFQGRLSLREIAAQLNDRRLFRRNGGQWKAEQVRRVLLAAGVVTSR